MKDQLFNWTDVLLQSLQSFGNEVMSYIPTVIGVVFIFLIGYLLARVARFLVTKVLKIIKFDDLCNKIKTTELLENANITTKPSKIVSKLVYWVLMLLVIMTITDTFGWSMVSNEVSNFVSYLPKLFIAATIFIIGTYIAKFVKNFIKSFTSSLGITQGNLVSNIVYYFLLIIIVITSLNQAGIDTSLISNNVMLILAAFLLTMAVSYAIASREVTKNILSGFVVKKSYKEGDVIEVNNIKGKVMQISATHISLQNDNITTNIPVSNLIDNEVKIYS